MVMSNNDSTTQTGNSTNNKNTTTSTFSNIGKSISLTAHVLVSSSDINDTVLSPSGPYNKMMSSTLKESKEKKLYPSHVNIIKNNAASSYHTNGIIQPSNQYFKNNLISERKTFQLLSHINDYLLQDIDSNAKVNNKNGRSLITNGTTKEQTEIPSLYQGFQTLALNDDPKDKSAASNSKLLLESPTKNAMKNPIVIGKSFSVPFLREFETEMINQLNKYEIKKNITISEIENIDQKINALKFRRNLLFNNIATLEEKELTIENDLALVKDRILSLSDLNDLSYFNNPSNDQDTIDTSTCVHDKIEISSPDLKSTNTRISTISNDLANETSSIDMSNNLSEYVAYKENNSPSNLAKFFQDRNKKHIKISPTLHQYFDPGSKISSFNRIHASPISSFQFDLPFGHLCSSSYDNPEIKIWDLSRDTQIGTLFGHNETVHCMEMDKSYNMLVSGSRDTTIKMWDLTKSIHTYNNDSHPNSIVCIYSFNEHMDTVTNLSINSNFMVSGSQDSTIRQWDMHSGKCVQILDLMSNDNINLFTQSSTPTVKQNSRFYNSIYDKDEVPKIGGLQSYDVALATGTNDGIVRLWDLRSGEVVRSLLGHTAAISCLKFDLQNIITGSLDQTVRTWDLRMGSSVNILEYDAPITSLDFDAKKIIIADGSTQVQVYDRTGGQHLKCSDEDLSGPTINLIQYRDNYLVGSKMDGSIHTWAI